MLDFPQSIPEIERIFNKIYITKIKLRNKSLLTKDNLKKKSKNWYAFSLTNTKSNLAQIRYKDKDYGGG